MPVLAGLPGDEKEHRTRRYIREFDAAAEKATGHLDLHERMIIRYPDRINRGVLWNSAKAVAA